MRSKSIITVDGYKFKDLNANGKLDPRLYWTIGTYETDWEDFEYGNVAYTNTLTPEDNIVTNNINGGLPIAKFTNLRTGLYSTVVTGLHDGINLRLMRYSDVLLRAAACPTAGCECSPHYL